MRKHIDKPKNERMVEKIKVCNFDKKTENKNSNEYNLNRVAAPVMHGGTGCHF